MPLLRPEADLDALAAATAAAMPAGGGGSAPGGGGGGGGASTARGPARFLVLDQYGTAARPTTAHTAEARDFIWAHTREVLRGAGAM